MASSLGVVALAFYHLNQVSQGKGRGAPTPPGATSGAGIVTLVALVVFIACFAFSMGPIVWTVINEIFPSRVRGRAVAVATAVNWFAAFLVSEFFLTLVGWIGTAGTFLLFAGFSAIAYVWVSKRVPETKGRSLEQIQELWATPDPVAAAELPYTS